MIFNDDNKNNTFCLLQNQVDRSKKGIAKLTEHAFEYEFVRNFVFKKAREQVMKMSNGLYPAPLKVCFNFCRFLIDDQQIID